jgi:cytosine deaminase
MARRINSGCERIFYVANDTEGGMVHLQENLPSIWRELASRQTFAVAKCSSELQQAAHNILMLNAQELNQRLLQR